MPRHLTEDDALIVQEEGASQPVAGAIDFTGAGVQVDDDGGTDTTVVTVASSGGGVTLVTDNWVEYYTSSWAGGNGGMNLGTVIDSGAGLSWIGSTEHDPSLGLIETTEAGLYVVNCRAQATGALTVPPTYPPQILVSTYDYSGNHNQVWDGLALRLVGASPASTGVIGCNVNFTVPVAADDVFYFQMYYRSPIASFSVRTYIARLA
jgi:hypothetical protein